MLSQLVLYLSMLLIGGLIGYFNMTHKKIDQALSKLQIISLLFILFIMGIRLGADEQVVTNVRTIGFKALVLAFGSVLFSLLFVYVGRKLFHLGKGGVKS